MGTSTWIAGLSPDRRQGDDRRVASSILCQEALARIVVETRGEDSYAGRALQELQRRRAGGEGGSGDDELIIYSLRGRWIVGTVREIRAEMAAADAAACRRRSAAAAALPSLLERELAGDLPPGTATPQ